MKDRKRNLKIVEVWYSCYHWIIPLIFTTTITVVAYKYKLYPWLGKSYSDMLTALITFQSIIISVFGIMIPALITAKEERSLVRFFFENADAEEFVKRIKKTVISGITDILLICVLYAYDVLPLRVYVTIGIICIFFLLYFLCGSYRYVSIMLRLLMIDKKRYAGKKFKKQISNKDREDLNRRLKSIK